MKLPSARVSAKTTRARIPVSRAPKVAGHTGSQGLTLLRYIGGNSGEMTYVGAVTGAEYKFGGSKELGYVDVRDVPAMLTGRKLSRGRRSPVEFKKVEA